MPTLASLPEKQQRYVKARARGLNKRDAARHAGYADSTAAVATSRVETPEVREVFRDIIDRAAGMDQVAATLVAGLHATEVKLAQCEGKFTDRVEVPDHAARLASAKIIAEYAGYVAKDEAKHLHLHALGSLSHTAQIDETKS